MALFSRIDTNIGYEMNKVILFISSFSMGSDLRLFYITLAKIFFTS